MSSRTEKECYISLRSRLTNAYKICILVCMRTTLIIKDELLKKAIEATGITEKTAVIHKGLEALIQNAAKERLIKLGGASPKAKPIPRRRTK